MCVFVWERGDIRERKRECWSAGKRYMRLKQEKMERSRGECVFACVCGRESVETDI